MKMKLDLSKFKRISMDDKMVILKHPDGHTFHVAVKALHPENRKNLELLQQHEDYPERLAEGGEAKKDKGPKINPKAAKEVQEGASQSGWQPDTWKKNIKEGLGLAKGGKVPAKDKLEVERLPEEHPLEVEKIPEENPLQVEPILPEKDTKRMAQGGYADPTQEHLLPGDRQWNEIEKSVVSTARHRMADGGEMQPEQSTTPQMPEPQQQPLQSQPQQSLQSPLQPQISAMPEQQQPDVMSGYNKQVQGIQGQAQAESQKANEEAQGIATHLKAVNNLMTDYQSHVNDLNKERQAFSDDIRNQHIDPNKYIGSMSTGQKFDTAIGLILGGFGGGGNNNAAMDFLNKQIDRDIAAQQAELGKKHSLLSANMQQFGNLRDATEMTKVMMNDMIINKLKLAETKATSPIAKARAQQQIGQLEQQIAPLTEQLATRRMLNQVTASGHDGQKLPMDPATLVPSVVPKEHQEPVFKEIERAQNTRKVADSALKNFDQYAGLLKSAGGLGRLPALGLPQPEKDALEAELGSTVGDMEGTVRETAMHNVKNAYLPRITDSAEKLDKRRQELAEYLKLKSSAPRAKSFGLDLDKFSSTTRQQAPQQPQGMSSQDQMLLELARKNPSHPNAKRILKKLGVSE